MDENDNALPTLIATRISEEVKTYLSDRSISDSTVIDSMGWQVLPRDSLKRILGRDVKFIGGLFMRTGERNGSMVGQVVMPRTLEIDRASFLPLGAETNKLCTRGAQMLSVTPYPENDQDDGTIYLCESPLKAAAMFNRGYFAAAGCGVASLWSARGGMIDGWERIHALIGAKQITRIRVLFDNDFDTNVNVSRAVNGLLSALRGQYPDLTVDQPRIPTEWGDKKGIDDVLAEWDEEGTREEVDARLAAFLCEAESTSVAEGAESASRAWFNERYTRVLNPSGILDFAGGNIQKKAERQINSAHRDFVAADLNGRLRSVCALSDWLSWPESNVVGSKEYKPGGDKCVFGSEGYFNTWVDDGVVPVAGDVAPFFEAYRNALGGDEVGLNELVCSMAWMLQNRGKKLPRTFYAVGQGQGTGKSTLAQLMMDMLGDSNTQSIADEALSRDFNQYAIGTEFVLLDDVDTLSKKQNAQLKRLATDIRIQANSKGQTEYMVDNLATFFITANHINAVPVEVEDRRILVLKFEPSTRWAAGGTEWADYHEWRLNGGTAAMRHYLEGLDIGGFNVFAAPQSGGKVDIAGIGDDDLDSCLRSMKDDFESYWGSSRRLYTSFEIICNVYGEEEASRMSRSEKNVLSRRVCAVFPYALRQDKNQETRMPGGWKGRMLEIAPPVDGAKVWTKDSITTHLREFMKGTPWGEG